MKLHPWMRHGRVLLLSCIAISSAHAVTAGRILTAAGEVTVLRAGATVKLERNSTVETGDRIQTGSASNAQVRFTDGSIVALRPDTQFAIEAYQFVGTPDSEKDEKLLFALLRGGLRTITGLIGRNNHNAYTMRTSTATVGIRGTNFNLVVCQQDCRNNDGSLSRDGLYGGVLDGTIAIKNEAQERTFGKEDVFFVADAKAPVEKLLAPPAFLRDRLDGQARARSGGQAQQTQQARTDGQQGSQQQGQTSAPPPPPGGTEAPGTPPPPTNTQVVQTTQNLGQGGTSVVVPPVTTLPFIPPFIGQGNGVTPPTGVSGRFLIAENSYPNTTSPNALDSGSDNTLQVDAQGRIMSFLGGQFSVNPAQGYTASVYESGSDGGAIAWGRWAGGTMNFAGYGVQNLTTIQGMHVIYGVVPTSFPQLNSVTFSLIGATMPAEVTNTPSGNVWSVSGGSVTANFLSSSYSGNLALALASNQGASAYLLSFNGAGLSPSSTNGWNGAVTQSSGTQNVCGAQCNATGTLIFAGTNASHAGNVYQFQMVNGTWVQGATVLKR